MNGIPSDMRNHYPITLPVLPENSDQARMNTPTSPHTQEPVKISSHGQQASALLTNLKTMDEVRPEIVSAFKTKIARGDYPPPPLIEGLARLLQKQPENLAFTS